MPDNRIPIRKRRKFLEYVELHPGVRLSVLSRDWGYLFIRWLVDKGDVEVRNRCYVYPVEGRTGDEEGPDRNEVSEVDNERTVS